MKKCCLFTVYFAKAQERTEPVCCCCCWQNERIDDTQLKNEEEMINDRADHVMEVVVMKYPIVDRFLTLMFREKSQHNKE